VKLTSSGQLDKSFDGNGIAAANFGYSGGADAMLVQSDGKIVLAGAGTASMYGYPFVALARFTSTGALDPNFSGDGKVGKGESTEPNSYGADPEHFTLLRTADGTYRVFDAAQDYDSSSTIETRFDANGVMQSNQASFPSAFQNVIQLKDGTFAGVSNVFDGYMRYYTPTVTFFDLNDKDLGSNGIQFDTGFAPGVIDSSGKLVLSSITQTGQYLLYRFSTNGKLDASFAQGGRTVFNDNPDYILDVPTIWPLGDGRLVLAGGGHDNQEGFYLGMGMQVSRLNIDGSRDQTYKSGPEYPAYAGARALLPHGNVSVGYVPWSEWDDQTIGIGVLVRSDGTSASVSTEPDSDSDNYTEVDRVLPVRGSNALIVLLKYNFLTLLDPNDPWPAKMETANSTQPSATTDPSAATTTCSTQPAMQRSCT
jgi:uncharacterized delta-60 repeat protein